MICKHTLTIKLPSTLLLVPAFCSAFKTVFLAVRSMSGPQTCQPDLNEGVTHILPAGNSCYINKSSHISQIHKSIILTITFHLF